MLLLVHVGTLYLVRTDLNCSSVASVRTPVGSKWVRLTLNPASDRYCRNLFSLGRQEQVLRAVRLRRRFPTVPSART